jgi:hypothetical protein
MKKYIQLLAFGILLAATTNQLSADQAIYKAKGVTTIIGRGSEQKIKPDAGYWVYDKESRSLTAIAAFTMHGKKFIQVVELDKLTVITVRGSADKSYTSIAKAESPSTQLPASISEGIYAIGQDAVVSLDGLKNTIIPKNFKSFGFSQISFGSGHFMTTQSQGVAILDLKASQESNSKQNDHDTVVNQIAGKLKARGYTENKRLLRTK